MITIGINGFGRIGRALFKLATRDPEVSVSAVNDLAEKEKLQYLLTHDSVYGPFAAELDTVAFFQERNPENIPWGEHGVDVVVECTGVFRHKQQAEKHLKDTVKHVVVSAPSPDAPTVLMGVNEELLASEKVTSNASCTTNAASPVVTVMDEAFGVASALLSTTHAYTATQSLVDGVHAKDLRRGRAAAINIIPTTTGAARAFTRAYPQLKGSFDGVALRVPVPAGSIVDVTMQLKQAATVEEIHAVLTKASESERWRSVFAVTTDPVVSTDIIGRPKASIADLSLTKVAGNLVKVFAWYDNEVGYVSALLVHIKKAVLAKETVS